MEVFLSHVVISPDRYPLLVTGLLQVWPNRLALRHVYVLRSAFWPHCHSSLMIKKIIEKKNIVKRWPSNLSKQRPVGSNPDWHYGLFLNSRAKLNFLITTSLAVKGNTVSKCTQTKKNSGAC